MAWNEADEVDEDVDEGGDGRKMLKSQPSTSRMMMKPRQKEEIKAKI
jgi:hypothetical protein